MTLLLLLCISPVRCLWCPPVSWKCCKKIRMSSGWHAAQNIWTSCQTGGQNWPLHFVTKMRRTQAHFPHCLYLYCVFVCVGFLLSFWTCHSSLLIYQLLRGVVREEEATTLKSVEWMADVIRIKVFQSESKSESRLDGDESWDVFLVFSASAGQWSHHGRTMTVSTSSLLFAVSSWFVSSFVRRKRLFWQKVWCHCNAAPLVWCVPVASMAIDGLIWFKK